MNGLALQQAATALVLPPVGLVLACLIGGALAWHGWRRAGLVVMLAAIGLLLLGTPLVAGLLMSSLEREVTTLPPAAAPGAIVILGAELAAGGNGADIGPMTLERLRAGAALHRRTGLPILVTGGVLAPGSLPLAVLMARSLETDFGIPARWVEPEAADTRGNARLSAVMLHGDGIDAAYVVTHAWHLPRAMEAFARTGMAAVAAPVRPGRRFEPALSDWLPRPDHLTESWFALREWSGRLVYALRD